MVSVAGEPLYRSCDYLQVPCAIPLGRGWGMEGRLNDLSEQSPPYCPILTTK